MDHLPGNDETPPVAQPQVAPTSPAVVPPTEFVNPGIAPTPPPSTLDSANSAVNIVWQWVCYGLWEWALTSLAVLLTVTLDYYFNNSSGSGDYTSVLYILAAMLCLLPLALVANYIYSKHEVNQKHGFSAVIMVINAVGVFLASIGALITLVVSILSLFTSPTSSTSVDIVIASSGIVTVLGAMLFIRIINPAPIAWFTKLFPYLVLGVAGLAVVLAVVGPFRSQIANRQDSLIEQNLPTLNDDIQSYATNNNKLPDNLSQVDTTADQGAQQLVKSNLVTYQNLGTTVVTNRTTTYFSSASTTSELSYQLCATFKSAKGTPSTTHVDLDTADNQSFALDQITTSHLAGKQCFKLTANDNSN
jgi:hypothetical protein